ncbi:Conserved_hypothetical protein [Hexamita inflata]|uniref:Uncharacterized protein n=1 Tax=Hexamita inflata TaxID=28002 RepID=A0AA86Q3E8_9EUKA|nr:Conserved hypothetical protein [Hexamita inflata]
MQMEHSEEIEEYTENSVSDNASEFDVAEIDRFEATYKQLDSASQSTSLSRLLRIFQGAETDINAARRLLIFILQTNFEKTTQISNALGRRHGAVPEELTSLYLGACAKHLELMSESLQRNLFSSAVDCYVQDQSGYVLAFLTQFFRLPLPIQTRVRMMRRLTKVLLYSEDGFSAYRKTYLQMLKNQATDFKQACIINFTRELNQFTMQTKAFKAAQLFSNSQKKINRTYKKNTTDEASNEEKAAERLSAKQVYEFIQLILAMNDGTVDYPIVEICLNILNYLQQYPKTFPFILKLSQLLCKKLNLYVPLLQLFINILLNCALPLSKSTLEINPQQYKAKLFNDVGEVTFDRILCVPSQFAKTLAYKEAIVNLTFQTIDIFFLRRLQIQPVTYPEATNAFRLQLNELLKCVEQKQMCQHFGFKFEYSGFQFGFQKNMIKSIKKLKQQLQADSELVMNKRRGIDLLEAEKIEFKLEEFELGKQYKDQKEEAEAAPHKETEEEEIENDDDQKELLENYFTEEEEQEEEFEEEEIGETEDIIRELKL